jgi:hypothetical protein
MCEQLHWIWMGFASRLVVEWFKANSIQQATVTEIA